jgi:hypothetical protein
VLRMFALHRLERLCGRARLRAESKKHTTTVRPTCSSRSQAARMALRRSVPFAVGDEGTPAAAPRALMAAAGLLHRRCVVESEDAGLRERGGRAERKFGPTRVVQCALSWR